MARKKKPTPTIADRAVEASLNGSNALAVFEQAASDLDYSAQELDKLALEALETAELARDAARIEAEVLVARAQNESDGLELLAITLKSEAAGHVRRAGKIRELVGA